MRTWRPEDKIEKSEEIDRLTEEFLAKGNKIKTYEQGETGDAYMKNIKWDGKNMSKTLYQRRMRESQDDN